MTQINQKTRVSRSVRRRPKMPTEFLQASENCYPSNWTLMDSTTIFKTVELEESDAEYTRNTALMKQTLPNCKIIKIFRIQSPYLWNAYKNKKEFLMRKSKVADVKESFLFHGTKSNNIKDICEQNLDWRLHGSNVGHMYGRGTYFSNR